MPYSKMRSRPADARQREFEFDKGKPSAWLGTADWRHGPSLGLRLLPMTVWHSGCFAACGLRCVCVLGCVLCCVLRCELYCAVCC